MVRNCRTLSRSAASADAPRRSARRAPPRPDRGARRRSRAGAQVARRRHRRPLSRAPKTTVPNTRRIGWAKLPAVYCVRGLGSGKPQSQAGAAAHRVARPKRWMTQRREPGRARDEQEDQQAVIGAAALGDRHDRQPGHARSAPACARRPARCVTGASASITSPGSMPASRQSAARTTMAASEKRSVSARLGRRWRARAGRGR